MHWHDSNRYVGFCRRCTREAAEAGFAQGFRDGAAEGGDAARSKAGETSGELAFYLGAARTWAYALRLPRDDPLGGASKVRSLTDRQRVRILRLLDAIVAAVNVIPHEDVTMGEVIFEALDQVRAKWKQVNLVHSVRSSAHTKRPC